MQSVSNDNFGLLIAYAIPGLIVVWGLSELSPTIAVWLGAAPAEAPTVAGFLYVTIASVAAGLLCSTVRWLVIDTLHHRTGLKSPPWDFASLRDRVEAFSRLVDDHYVYYKFHANLLVAVLFSWACRRLVSHPLEPPSWSDLGGAALVIVLFVGSRDNLRKYYDRAGALLAMPQGSRSSPTAKTSGSRRKQIPNRHIQGHGQSLDVEQ